MQKLLSRVPAKFRPIVYGGLVGVPLGLFLLIHKSKPTSGSTSGRFTATGTGVGIPVGGPEHTITRTVTKWRNPKTHVPRTDRGTHWARYNQLQGRIARALREVANANHYMKSAERSHNRAWIRSLEASIRNHENDIRTLRRESRAAWLRASGRKH